MMGELGYNNVQKMQERKNKKDSDEGEDKEHQWTSRFIIPPNNYWYMLWNNFLLAVFISYIIVLPLFISYEIRLTSD